METKIIKTIQGYKLKLDNKYNIGVETITQVQEILGDCKNVY